MKKTVKLTSLLLVLLFSFQMAFAQGIAVSGIVLDEYNEGLPGASVIVKGSKVGVITDFDGKFSINVPDKKAVLQVSFLGYTPQDVPVGNQTMLKIKLSNNSKELDEVVIVGFGTQKKINATGAVKTIDNKVLASRPITNAVQGLQGAIAGLNITNDNGGAPGQSMDINIRGIGSIGEGSVAKPLVLIDGIEGDLSTVNPNDIENISVLKDASAASIYGSRAPFGVILVTTKSGQKETSVNYSGNMRIGKPINVPNMVDSYTYALMVNDAFTNEGGGAQFSQSQLNKILAYQRGELEFGTEAHPSGSQWLSGQQAFGNTNWYDVYLKDQNVSQEHNLSLTGGGEKVVYYLSGNYMRQNGLFNYADDYYERLTFNAKLNFNILKNLKLTWNTRFMNDKNDKPSAMNELFFHNLGRRSSNVPVYLPNGEYNPESLIPAIQDGGRLVKKNTLLNNQLQLTYQPLKGWGIYFDLGHRVESPSESRQFKTLQVTQPNGEKEYVSVLEGVMDVSKVNADGTFRRQPPAGVSYYERMRGNVYYLNSNIRTDYERTWKKHYFKALVGVQTEYFYNEKLRSAADNILINDKPFLPDAGGSNYMSSERKGEWATMGIFGRVNYNYDNRYMAEVNLRTDGASRFPKDQRWGTFPSFSLGWNIGQESFWSKISEAGFETFKLRGSYGFLGNQNTRNFYPYFQNMAYNVDNGIIIGGSIAQVLPMPLLPSTDITWENVKNIGVGVDFGFFQNRLNASFDWFERKTIDMVGPAPSLPGVFGAATPLTNNAELRTAGWDIELSYKDRIGKDFSYDITATLSDFQSTVTKYDSPDGRLDGFYKNKKLGDIWGFRVDGIAKSDLEMDQWLANNNQSALGSKWGAGDIKYKDTSGNGVVDKGAETIYDHGDLEVIGNGTPRYSYGIRLNARYKFIDFGVFFQGIGKRDVFFKDSAPFFGVAGAWQRTLLQEHTDYFRPAGHPLGANFDSYYARLRTNGNNRHVSDHYLQDASYLRLKNLQIGFNLPSNTKLSRVIKNARLYVSGENLLTFTKLRILDPESIGSDISEYGSGKTYPMFSTYSIGLSITL